jgi:ABC-type Fe3+-hydroxamate transport system substrate-binding protein
MRIIFCGDRKWDNYKVICDVMADMNPDVVIEGEADGADSLAKDAAEYFGIPVVKFPANWQTYGKAAGPIRNLQMIEEGKPDLVIAFHDDVEHSRGTRNMVDQALKKGLKVMVYTQHGCQKIYQAAQGLS